MEPPPDRLPELNLDIEPGARQRLETQYVMGYIFIYQSKFNIYVPLTIANTYIYIITISMSFLYTRSTIIHR